MRPEDCGFTAKRRIAAMRMSGKSYMLGIQMAFIVEMVRRGTAESEDEFHSCSASSWRQLLVLAGSFGWQPEGTIRDEAMARGRDEYDKWFKPTYDVEDWANCKRLSEADARHLGEALIAAHDAIANGRFIDMHTLGPGIFRDDMSTTETTRVNADSLTRIQSFAEFALGGSFAFAWDD